ncbi:UDP-N-acetylglucosamine 2-epimerase (non-hydrolyzing) [Candidatus Aminicenantes bacterium AC-335-K20]|jgi:UDP-N-acetylglucosamine 2-epimerase (non-hydrolysing)|nr:UDP-N-acetylglucosamine 2-epimerase (non-hydrolyzing) [SCandidatus Aminicenantes bacterium Aminicenantia_JdfR_composite]MCP2596548.1 UDP-N-acetylglucosamine 2-epimerase (non-hydrolyzing) [Candidatus Aminicenantes bacterium AC-335-G13]MCP2598314.1 UDP-N-acetylglucosamine 2-epimerase (non-hydrolyzing) [Candidatus Aminicenantes bacterium AC-335-L06]MCP2605446.1 UDP-N-acetylglucosamine 2-epimerase (non-hydrolyzing) [Candidatus Aminicenantes bacterium AC-335-O07]MCP2606107.1 UDP-N-acetylglucosami
MHKVIVIFGTRPEAIKLAPIILKLKTISNELSTIVCVTAQHREMLDQVLNIFEIEPDYDLNIMKDNQSLFDITVEGLRKLERVLKKEKPNIILVQGDTTTTFLASLAGYYLKIKIGHVEAGLRTKDKFNPFPEEMNRRLTDCLADLYFAPTKRAKENLLKEGVDENKIFITGNTVIDALLMVVEKQKNKEIQKMLEQKFCSNYRISFDNRKIILVTGHRRESFGKELENICLGLKKIAKNNYDIQIIYPVHLNPNVQKPVRKILSNIDNIHLIEPLDYFSFVWLMNKSYLILTDSGGIQEEAPSLGKPILVMRNKTERPEGIEAGTAKLVGTDSEKIYSETMRLLENKTLYEKMAKAINPYGDGKASDRITNILRNYLAHN